MNAAERRLIAGIDLNSEHPMICYYEQETDHTVTAPLKVGHDDISFRDMLEEREESECD